MKKTKSKIKIGEYTIYKGTFLIVQEVFLAENVIWVRCTYNRKNYKVKYSNKLYQLNDTENKYMTEAEWQFQKKI